MAEISNHNPTTTIISRLREGINRLNPLKNIRNQPTNATILHSTPLPVNDGLLATVVPTDVTVEPTPTTENLTTRSTEEAANSIREILDRIRSTDRVYGSLRAQLIDEMIMNTEDRFGDSLTRILGQSEFNLDTLSYLLRDELVFEIMAKMLDHASAYRKPLAMLLSAIPFQKLPQTLQDKIDPIRTNEQISVKPEHNGWGLCSKTEYYMDEAIGNNIIVIANNHLLTKGLGRLTALCLETFTTPTGATFLEGAYYSPVDTETREGIRTNLKQGKPHYNSSSGTWAFMRAIRDNKYGMEAQTLLDEARKKAQEMPESLPEEIETFWGEKLTRDKYIEIMNSDPTDFDESRTQRARDSRRDEYYKRRELAQTAST